MDEVQHRPPPDRHSLHPDIADDPIRTTAAGEPVAEAVFVPVADPPDHQFSRLAAIFEPVGRVALNGARVSEDTPSAQLLRVSPAPCSQAACRRLRGLHELPPSAAFGES